MNTPAKENVADRPSTWPDSGPGPKDPSGRARGSDPEPRAQHGREPDGSRQAMLGPA